MQNGGQKDNFIILTCNSTNARMESLQNCIKCKSFTIWWCLMSISCLFQPQKTRQQNKKSMNGGGDAMYDN
jgi:hypothetical protein